MTKKEKRETRLKFRDKDSRMVEKVLEHYRFEPAKRKLIDLYFFNGKSVVQTCLSVGICRATFFNWTNEILEIAYKWANELKTI
jgi:hypothetical protein